MLQSQASSCQVFIRYKRNQSHRSSDKQLGAEVTALPELGLQVTVFSEGKASCKCGYHELFPPTERAPGHATARPQHCAPCGLTPFLASNTPSSVSSEKCPSTPSMSACAWDSSKVEFSFYFLTSVGHEAGKGSLFLLLCFESWKTMLIIRREILF